MTLHLLPTQADRAWQRATRFTCERSLSEIISTFADERGVKVTDLVGPSKKQTLARHRQDCMATIRREKPSMSLPDIGRAFNRDHTTVLHALRAVEKRAAQ
ncbi:helix-turn-helix domain-containing protein [Celeribacter sp. SCSIO 80788]|uniref:helix-turn-helix domain-containing protein n=1 Tax=Celeribacter sp. SCSIO 80788 TaxID=3117013 RepID=UPI003DA5C42E